MLHSKVYGLWACITYGLISAASTSGASQAPELRRQQIFSTVLTTCDNSGPVVFAPAVRRLYGLSSEGVTSLRLPGNKGKKTKFAREIALVLPEQPISTLAVDTRAKKVYVSYGAQVGEIILSNDWHMLDGSDDTEPEWHRPIDTVEKYKNDQLMNVGSPITALCLAAKKEFIFSASPDRICRWSTKRRALDAREAQVSPTLAMQVYGDALFTMHANGDLQSVPLQRDVAQHNGTFDGKAMRVAAFDEPEKKLYTVSHEGKLYTLDINAQEVTHTTEVKTTGIPTALATKNHGVFVGDDQGAIRFYDTRKAGVVRRLCSQGAVLRQMWYDRKQHNLISLDDAGTLKRYWME